MNPLGMLAGGGLSASSSATSGASVGNLSTTTGAFGFGGASTGNGGAGGTSSWVLPAVAAGGLVLGFILCRVMR